MHAVLELANSVPAAQNLHVALATLFLDWYFPVAHDLHAVLEFTNSVPAAQNLHDALD